MAKKAKADKPKRTRATKPAEKPAEKPKRTRATKPAEKPAEIKTSDTTLSDEMLNQHLIDAQIYHG